MRGTGDGYLEAGAPVGVTEETVRQRFSPSRDPRLKLPSEGGRLCPGGRKAAYAMSRAKLEEVFFVGSVQILLGRQSRSQRGQGESARVP